MGIGSETESREHLTAIGAGKKEKPATAELRAKLAEAKVRDTMNSLVQANAPQIKELGWDVSVGNQRNDRAIPPPPIPEATKEKPLRRKQPHREENQGDQAAA